MALLAVLGIAGCGESHSGHPPLSSPCSAFRDDAWPPNTDVVAWHPSGTQIFFSIGVPNAGVYAITPEGSELSQVARSGRVAATVDEARLLGFNPVGPAPSLSLSPGGSILVYATCTYLSRPEKQWPEHYDYLPELAQVQTTGAHVFRLTENAEIDDYPAWSPDGTRIAFLSDRGTDGEDRCFSDLELFTMAWDGSDVRCHPIRSELVAIDPTESTVKYKIVFNSPRNAFTTPVRATPQWSPDGRQIAIAVHEDVSITGEWGSPREDRFAIYSVGSDGTGWQRLTDARSGPSWSPDGQRLAFARLDGDDMALYTIAADGSHTRRVTIVPREHWVPDSGEPDLTKAWIRTIAWSPDGSKILYTCGGICVVELDGTPTSEVPLPGDVAAWSPDGSRIATVTIAPQGLDRRNSEVLRTMAPDGSEVRVLVRLGSGYYPVAVRSV